jgi:hypothetical protein
MAAQVPTDGLKDLKSMLHRLQYNTEQLKILTYPVTDTNGTAAKSSNGTNKPEDGIDDQDSEDEDKEAGEGHAVEGGMFYVFSSYVNTF